MDELTRLYIDYRKLNTKKEPNNQMDIYYRIVIIFEAKIFHDPLVGREYFMTL